MALRAPVVAGVAVVGMLLFIVPAVMLFPIKLLALWFIYGSYERVGQTWFSFGWEIQILETGLIAAFAGR